MPENENRDKENLVNLMFFHIFLKVQKVIKKCFCTDFYQVLVFDKNKTL